MKIHVWSLFSALKIQKMVTNLISIEQKKLKKTIFADFSDQQPRI